MTSAKSKVSVERVNDIQSYPTIRDVLSEVLGSLDGNLRLNSNSMVFIKTNLCLLKGPETGATVDPGVAMALVEWLNYRFGVKKIFIAEADATHLSADMAFRALGWKDFFNGIPEVELFNLSRDVQVAVPGRYVSELLMSKTMMTADCLISLAKLKTHTQQKITCIMKNQFGAIPYKYKIVYHPMLTQAIYDATAARKPDLCIVDGLIAMEGNGPTNGIPRRTKLLLAGNDAVSMDHFCARLMGFRPLSVPSLRLAVEQRLGRTDYEVAGSPPNPLSLRFKFLPKWKEVLKKCIGLMQRGTVNEEA